eukprot:5724256-Pleurochrysis_carterae.AAC.1
MFAFSANEASQGLDSTSASAFGLIFLGETPIKSNSSNSLTPIRMQWTKEPTGQCFVASYRTPHCHALREISMPFRQSRTRLRDRVQQGRRFSHMSSLRPAASMCLLVSKKRRRRAAAAPRAPSYMQRSERLC